MLSSIQYIKITTHFTTTVPLSHRHRYPYRPHANTRSFAIKPIMIIGRTHCVQTLTGALDYKLESMVLRLYTLKLLLLLLPMDGYRLILHMSYMCHTHTHHIHTSYTPHTHHIHTTYTPNAHHIHTTYTPHTHRIHTAYTQHTHHIHTYHTHLSYICRAFFIYLLTYFCYIYIYHHIHLSYTLHTPIVHIENTLNILHMSFIYTTYTIYSLLLFLSVSYYLFVYL